MISHVNIRDMSRSTHIIYITEVYTICWIRVINVKLCSIFEEKSIIISFILLEYWKSK